ncbi:hypothetical protein BLA29_008578, partial [Euroglyphus maynei]
MGNILHSIYSRKKSNNSIDDCQTNENDGKLFRSSSKKSKKESIKFSNIDHDQPNEQNLIKNDESKCDNYKDHQSPFQRDFYPPPHEILVPLEKYRPRRSNIRRSARIHPIKMNCVDKHNVGDILDEEIMSNLPKPDYESDAFVDNQNDEQVEDDEDASKVDDLIPSERTK